MVSEITEEPYFILLIWIELRILFGNFVKGFDFSTTY
jgi:hypothetical protein